ncbi:MAG: hypothetical protein KJ592_03990 [Nanoarchaeota archaeon]|nr:hypothetical protein [Nanoarchaeota archaeon]
MENRKMTIEEIIYASRQARAARALASVTRQEVRVYEDRKEGIKYNTERTQQ